MKLHTVIVISFLFTACSDDRSEENTNVESKEQDSTLFDTQLDSLEKAKGVEQSLEEAVQKREEAMRKQGT